jgi:hypothetical protein
VVWWVRKRLREEADLCCDAWVTALMPQGRRAYAQALLDTQRFLGGQRVAPPVTGLGVLSGGAKRFARRLTMVMTHRAPPHRSITGMALAALIAVAGLSTASLACPEKDKNKQKAKLEKERAVLVEVQPRLNAPRAARAPKAPTVTRSEGGEVVVVTPEAEEDGEASTYEQHLRARVRAGQPVPPAPPAPPTPPAPPARARSGMMVAPPAPPGAVTMPSHNRRVQALRAEEAVRAGRAPMAEGHAGFAGDDDVERRLDALERRLEKMEGRLDRILSAWTGGGTRGPPRRRRPWSCRAGRAFGRTGCRRAWRRTCTGCWRARMCRW